MNTEDKALASRARRSFVKTILDVSELNVSCYNGYIELTGKVRLPRNNPGAGNMNLRKELEALKQMVHNTRGVKGVYSDKLRIID